MISYPGGIWRGRMRKFQQHACVQCFDSAPLALHSFGLCPVHLYDLSRAQILQPHQGKLYPFEALLAHLRAWGWMSESMARYAERWMPDDRSLRTTPFD